MYVCKSFYQQFEWAVEEHWSAVSGYPVLICQGDEDQVTPMEGAQTLVALLLKHAQKDDPAATRMPASVSAERNEDIDNTKRDSCSRILLVVIGKAGHQLQEEQPKEIIAHMDLFFGNHCGVSLPAHIAVQGKN